MNDSCLACHQVFEKGERIVGSIRETFICKPAHIPDTVNPAKVSVEELRESRKDHKRTAVSTIYLAYGEGSMDNIFGAKHASCQREFRHTIRYRRGN